MRSHAGHTWLRLAVIAYGSQHRTPPLTVLLAASAILQSVDLVFTLRHRRKRQREGSPRRLLGISLMLFAAENLYLLWVFAYFIGASRGWYEYVFALFAVDVLSKDVAGCTAHLVFEESMSPRRLAHAP